MECRETCALEWRIPVFGEGVRHSELISRKSARTPSLYRTIGAALLAALVAGSSLVPAATPLAADQKKPKRAKFGSSLRRLRWDPASQAAVETEGETKGRASQSDDSIKLDTLLVVFDLLVVKGDKQQVVKGLSKDDFIITEDGKPQQVATFAMGDDATRPRSIILIIDYSNSQDPYLETSTKAAKTLIGKLGPQDEMAIVTDDVEMLTDFTRDRKKLVSTLDKIRKRVFEKHDHGQSLQFTALFAALRELTDNKDSRPIIIFQTDGDEAAAFRDQADAARFAFLRRKMPSPEYGLSDIYSAAEKSRATIYSVVTNHRLIGLPSAEYQRQVAQLLATRGFIRPGEYVNPEQASLIRLYADLFRQGQFATVRVATLTGGWTAWLERPDQAAGIYEQILSDIDQRYIIGYYPTNGARDGNSRKVGIEVKGHPEYKVHGRTTYYAPEH